jgi:hypothetical protein
MKQILTRSIKLTMFGLILCSPVAGLQAAAVYIDFGMDAVVGGNGGPTASPDSFGHFWNNVAQTNAQVFSGTVNTIGNMIDITGANTGIGFTLSVAGSTLANNSNANGIAAQTGIPDSATADFDYLNANAVATLTFTGLTVGQGYNFQFLSFRTGATLGQRVGTFSFVGNTTNNMTADASSSTLINVPTMTPNGSGTITVTWTRNDNVGGSAFSYLNYMTLSPVPEPSTVAMAAIGSLLLVVMVQRRKSTILS